MSRHMSKKQHARLDGYLNLLALYLGRGDWQLTLDREWEANEAAHASCLVNTDSTSAHISVSRSTAKGSPTLLRHVLVHEILHTYEQHVSTHVDDTFHDSSSVDHWNTFQATHQRLRERAVDQLAYHVAELLPLP